MSATGTTLIAKIDADLKDAARAKDKLRLGTLRMLKSAIGYRGIDLEQQKEPRALGDADVVAVLGTLIKQRRDSIQQYTAGGRPELAAAELAEIGVLEGYLPRQLSDDELAVLVQEAIAATGAKTPREMGAVMKALAPKTQGKAEGKRVSDAVKAALLPRG